VVGEAADGEEALQLSGTLHPDVAVLDVAMPVLNGIETAGEMRAISPKTKSILLTMHVDSRYILAGLRSGVKGYLMKTRRPSGRQDFGSASVPAKAGLYNDLTLVRFRSG
jgi:DNA-binding NarL/FixJ family response regulator